MSEAIHTRKRFILLVHSCPDFFDSLKGILPDLRVGIVPGQLFEKWNRVASQCAHIAEVVSREAANSEIFVLEPFDLDLRIQQPGRLGGVGYHWRRLFAACRRCQEEKQYDNHRVIKSPLADKRNARSSIDQEITSSISEFESRLIDLSLLATHYSCTSSSPLIVDRAR